MKNRFWDVLNRPMTVVSIQEVNTMYEECVCQRILKIKIFFISNIFLALAGTSQKLVKNRLPRCTKKSKIIDFAVFEPFFRRKKNEKSVLGRFKPSYGRYFDAGS